MFHTWAFRGEHLNQIIEINAKKVFRLEDAQSLLPVLHRMTEVADSKIRCLLQKLDTIEDRESVIAQDLEKEIDLNIRQWQQKIEKLGGRPQGLWLIDFDNGEGYFCWKFPERKIMFFHGYHDGFSGRKALFNNEEICKEEHKFQN